MRMRVAAVSVLLVASLTAVTACGGTTPPTTSPADSPAADPVAGPAVTGTYAFVEKDEQTLCDFLDADGKRYHLIYGGAVGHGVLSGGANGAPVLSFIYLGEDTGGSAVGADPGAYGARPDVIAVGERVTGWGALAAPATQDPCAPYDQVLTLWALKPA